MIKIQFSYVTSRTIHWPCDMDNLSDKPFKRKRRIENHNWSVFFILCSILKPISSFKDIIGSINYWNHISNCFFCGILPDMHKEQFICDNFDRTVTWKWFAHKFFIFFFLLCLFLFASLFIWCSFSSCFAVFWLAVIWLAKNFMW